MARMFTIHCPQEDTTILLGHRQIRGLENTDEGIVIHWRCYCGATGQLSPTGRASASSGRTAAEQTTSAAA